MGVCLKTMTAYPGIWSEREYQADFFPPTQFNIKADPSDFAAWLPAQSDATKNILVPFKEDSRWGKVCRIKKQVFYFDKDNKSVNQEDPEGHTQVIKMKQDYVICLDPKSPFAGNIHNNDSKLLIYFKLFESLCFRPIHTVGYTLYNLTLVHTAVIIFNGIKDKKPANETLQKVVCSLADIVRTPIYGTAILIVTIAALLSAPFHPTLVYDFRAVIARLNREFGWGEKNGLHDFTCCFQPHVNIMEYTLNEQKFIDGILYEDRTNPVLVGLDNK